MGRPFRAIEEKPEIDDGLLFYWNAYSLLVASRPVGMAPGAIPLSEMMVFCDLAGIDDSDDRIDFIRIMQAMDAELLDSQGGGAKCR